MPRASYVFDPVSGEIIDRDEYYARQPAPKRSRLSAPMLIPDGIEIKSMVDGKVYTSKAALRQSYRANGYAEVGNEPMKPAPRAKPDRKGISDAVGRAFNRAGISL